MAIVPPYTLPVGLASHSLVGMVWARRAEERSDSFAVVYGVAAGCSVFDRDPEGDVGQDRERPAGDQPIRGGEPRARGHPRLGGARSKTGGHRAGQVRAAAAD